MPFGPVEYVYDISDSYPKKSSNSLFGENDDVLEKLIAPYKTLGYEPIKEPGNFIIFNEDSRDKFKY